MQQLAIYDMDKTITRWPTWTPFLCYAAALGAPWRLILLPFVGLCLIGYACRAIDRAQLKELTQALMIGRTVRAAKIDALASGFAGLVTRRGVYRAARARIAADRTEGRRIVLATASYGFYANAIASQLGLDDVIATRSVYSDDGSLLIARIDGENCYGPAKLRMIEAWLADNHMARADIHARFYSDHVSDAPTLAWADEAIAVNPHAPLRALAGKRQWSVVDWAR